MILACVGVLLAAAPIYQTFATTERYEVEFATLFTLGGVATWLALSAEASDLAADCCEPLAVSSRYGVASPAWPSASSATGPN